MLGIDLYKEALINSNNSIYYGKKYKVKGDCDISTFEIKYNDIVRDDMTSLFSLNLHWIKNVFFKSELEEVKQEIEMRWYECIEKYAENINKYYIKVFDTISKSTYTYNKTELTDACNKGLTLYEIKWCKWYLCER